MHSIVAATMLVVAAVTPAAAQGPHRPALPRGMDLYFPVPRDNVLTPEKVALGRRLFFDSLLSRDGRVACVSCHDPARAFTDGRARSVGASGRPTPRSAPTLINRAYGDTHFWDGRAASLEAQVLGPIDNPEELGNRVAIVVERLRRDSTYARQFVGAMGRPADSAALAGALASYLRSILAGDSRFDRYVEGEADALTPIEREGLAVFRSKGRCTNCHVGPRFSDERFHNTGVAWATGELADSGRFVVTRVARDLGAFKTPTLREIARTAPYMHDGSLATLEDVVGFYERGGQANPHLDAELRPLRLTGPERAALLAFLRALNGDVREGW